MPKYKDTFIEPIIYIQMCSHGRESSHKCKECDRLCGKDFFVLTETYKLIKSDRMGKRGELTPIPSELIGRRVDSCGLKICYRLRPIRIIK